MMVVVLAVLVIYPLCSMVIIPLSSHKENCDTASGEAVLESLASVSAEQVQKHIDEVNSAKAQPLEADKKLIIEKDKKIESGKSSFRQAFKNVWFMGDSLMNGLEVYGVLNPSRLITQVSASLSHLESNIDKITEIQPKVLILHYGLNMISDNPAQLKTFISKYSSLISALKKNLPGTRIIVSLIFPVDTRKATAPRFKMVGRYDAEMKKMCKRLGVEYLDSTKLVKEHSDCLGRDGIHLSKPFYEHWLKFIMRNKGIY